MCLGISEGADASAACCDDGGVCVPKSRLPESLWTLMSMCTNGDLCVPNGVMASLMQEGIFDPKACVSMSELSGACLSTCFPKVAVFAAQLPVDVCEPEERCALCIDPLSGESTGVCDIVIDCVAELQKLETLKARRDAFLVPFARRVFRRPVVLTELQGYAALFDQGQALIGAGDPFSAGVEMVIGAMLQSPHFLYRVDGSWDVGADGLVDLDGWEIAARLSFALWNSTPTDALLDAAESGQLDTRAGVIEQAREMLDYPRAVEIVTDDHRQLLHMGTYDGIQKTPRRL